MTKEEVAEVMADFGLVTFNGYGFVYGPLRVETGGGIACKMNEWTITFPGYPEMKARGPFKTKRALRAALRELMVWALACALAATGVRGGRRKCAVTLCDESAVEGHALCNEHLSEGG